MEFVNNLNEGDKILPCRCGGIPELKSDNDGYSVVCSECSEGNGLFGCDEACSDNWNTTRKEDIKNIRKAYALKCLHSKEAKKILKTLLKQYPDASIFWNHETNEAELTIEDFSITINANE